MKPLPPVAIALIDGPAAHNSEQSLDAAIEIRGIAVGLRQRVLDAIRAHGPVTAQRLETITELSGDTIRPRLRELRARGEIVPAGEGTTRSGRRATMWDVAETWHSRRA